jgi:hypothetical protein
VIIVTIHFWLAFDISSYFLYHLFFLSQFDLVGGDDVPPLVEVNIRNTESDSVDGIMVVLMLMLMGIRVLLELLLMMMRLSLVMVIVTRLELILRISRRSGQ